MPWKQRKNKLSMLEGRNFDVLFPQNFGSFFLKKLPIRIYVALAGKKLSETAKKILGILWCCKQMFSFTSVLARGRGGFSQISSEFFCLEMPKIFSGRDLLVFSKFISFHALVARVGKGMWLFLNTTKPLRVDETPSFCSKDFFWKK